MVLNNGEFEGKRYLTPKSVKLMTTIQTDKLKTGFTTEGNGWCLGWCVIRRAAKASLACFHRARLAMAALSARRHGLTPCRSAFTS